MSGEGDPPSRPARPTGPIHDTDPAVADTEASDARRAPGEVTLGSTPPTKAPRPVRAGDRLGRYELIEEVGEGGMATVYRARDQELRRDVAIKVLFPHLARRADIVRRFHREARAAASLEHANILRIYDVGGAEQRDVDDPPYIVMELIRGRTLLQEVEERGPLLAEIVACIGALLADALAVAHAAGIVHRDIKPANVLVTHEGRLLLADFGVARMEHEDSLVTKTGALLGTPAYMSPEQSRGDIATAASDLYSLGAALYQLATAQLPYAGSPAKVIAAINAGPPMPAVRRRTAVGADLSRAIEQLMASDPAARPADAAAIGKQLVPIAAAGGLGDPADEVAAYIRDPAAYLATHTPSVVTALVTAAERAMDDAKLPRAMALADRASALAPDDPAVTALIASVAEGGRSRARRRWIALGGGGVVIAGGVIAAVLGGHHHGAAPVADDAGPLLLLPTDAAMPLPLPPTDAAMPLPLPLADADADADVPLPPADAAIRSVTADARATATASSSLRDAATRARDAAPLLPADAAPAPIDAAAIAPTLDAAPAEPARGAVLVVTDLWCNVNIDNISFGRNKPNRPLPIAAGHHTVTCAQPGTSKHWSREVDVVPGQTVIAEGKLLQTYNVVLSVPGSEVQIDAMHYPTGTTVHVHGGRPEVVVPGVARAFVDIRADCVLRVTDGQLSCDP